MRKLLVILLSVLSLTAMAQNKRVAVYVIGDDAGINKVLGSRLVSAIARSDEYSAIERTTAFLNELSKEQDYQRTGAVDDSDLSRLGKQFGAQYVCVATVSDAFNEKYLSARLIDVETAQVERTASSNGTIQTLDDIVTAADAISNELLSSLKNGRNSDSKKVAVYVVKSDAAKNIGRVLGDKLVAGFTNSGRYIAIERTNSFLSQLSKEQKYQRTGAVDDDDISRLGKQFGVQYVCVADVSDVLGEKFISARLVDVETAEVVNSHDMGAKMTTMRSCLSVANEIATNLSKGTFAEQAEEARLKAEEDARIKADQEKLQQEEDKRIKEQEKQARQQQELQESFSQLGNAIANIANPQYYLKVTNNRVHTRIVYVDGQKIGEISGLSVKTFVVPTKLYKKIEFVQKNYLISPDHETFTNNRQPQNGQTVEVVNNPL
jgi:curli biogenesis system outer membrane secretion channel CsgG